MNSVIVSFSLPSLLTSRGSNGVSGKCEPGEYSQCGTRSETRGKQAKKAIAKALAKASSRSFLAPSLYRSVGNIVPLSFFYWRVEKAEWIEDALTYLLCALPPKAFLTFGFSQSFHLSVLSCKEGRNFSVGGAKRRVKRESFPARLSFFLNWV